MPKALAVCVVFSFLASVPLWSQDQPSYQPFSPDELDNLLAPIALYPDPLLAQVLPAATFPDQIDEAARFIRGGADADAVDVQPWDVSVKSVAHYPPVLYMMADQLDWTTALGQAYANQPDDVMASIQRLRQDAENAGNLTTTPQEDVVNNDGFVDIWPAQPNYCYLPIYDPGLVYFGSGGVYGGPVIRFSPAFPIGSWLIYDFDWPHHRLYYHGWSIMNGWVLRAKPYIQANSVYVNPAYRNVAVNRGVSARPVIYSNLARYDSVHRNATFDRAGSGAGSPENVNNKIIQRNINVNDTRLGTYRGRSPEAPAPVEQAAAPAREPERTGNAAFGENRSSFGAQAASERGQTSRASRPAPAPKASGGGSHSAGGGGGSHGGGGGGGGGGSHAGGGGGGGHH